MSNRGDQYEEYLKIREMQARRDENAKRSASGNSDEDRMREYMALREETAKANKPAPPPKRAKKRRKKKGKGLKITFTVVLILVLGLTGICAAAFAVAKMALDNVGRIEIDKDAIGIDPDVDKQLENYRNIAVLGIDARDMSNDANSRSDAIIVASINKETNEIKLFSVYRDTMLDLGDEGLDKITHAYYYGGPTKTLYTLNHNMDLNIKEVAVVNWKAVADVVDALDGIEVDIQESEIDEMNKYIPETARNVGGPKDKIEKAGKQTLNGTQAVTYSRIRKDALTGDYRRNERMKIVVKATFKKAKRIKPRQLKKICKDILPEIKTNMTTSDMFGMALDLTSYEMKDSTTGWPYDVGSWSGAAWYGPPVTLSSNVTKLHEKFFKQKGYTPTEHVQTISQNISATTGLW